MRYFLTILFCLLCGSADARIIHQEKSLYRNIVVKETVGRRCLVFTLKRGDRNQTCMNMADPRKLVFPYVRMMLAGLLLNSDPRHILVIGLGGGSIPTVLAELFSQARIDVVEIDEAVVRVAKRYFSFSDSDRVTVHVADGRVYLKRAMLKNKLYDLIILDAFTGDYIPEHLMTVEFLTETKSLLTGPGVLVANTFSSSELYDHESVTYQQVFGDFLNFKMPNTGNRVILTSLTGLPSQFVLRSKARLFSSRLHSYDVDIDTYPAHMSRQVDWDREKRALTDQYNPANLLQGEY